MPLDAGTEQLLAELPAVSLEQLDERAALLRRTDTKYVLQLDAFAELLRKLSADHEALEIDSRRMFAYESVYFDTADLRCFRDHVEGRTPRFKARTRHYRDTGHCVFEVKLKLGDGETDKRQSDHPPDATERLSGDAEECLREALQSAGLQLPPEPLRASLRTNFDRVTLARADAAERATCDLDLTLSRHAAASARLQPGMVVVETKSEHGDGPADGALRELGVEPISLSKYRTGMALLAPEAQDPEGSRPSERYFTVELQGAAAQRFSRGRRRP